MLGVDCHMQRMGFQETLVESHALTMGAHMLGVAAHELRVVAQRMVAHELQMGSHNAGWIATCLCECPQCFVGLHALLWEPTLCGGKPRVSLDAHARAWRVLGCPRNGLRLHAFPLHLNVEPRGMGCSLTRFGWVHVIHAWAGVCVRIVGAHYAWACVVRATKNPLTP